jgi:RNA polymerase sigma-70 factor (ECF subfamily)
MPERNTHHLNILKETSLASLYDDYAPALYGIIKRIVHSDALAEEVLQDAFMKIWENRHTYNPDVAKPFTWMAAIARNLSINAIQSKRERNNKKIQPLDNVVHIDTYDEIRNKDAFDLSGLLSNLDPKYQQVVEYAYFKGYTQKEIADTMNMPLGSVKSCIKIALRELRVLYGFGISQTGTIVSFLMTFLFL